MTPGGTLKANISKILKMTTCYFKSHRDNESVSHVVTGCVVLRPDSLSGSLNLICGVCFSLKHQGRNSFIYMAPQEQMSQNGVATKREIKRKVTLETRKKSDDEKRGLKLDQATAVGWRWQSNTLLDGRKVK